MQVLCVYHQLTTSIGAEVFSMSKLMYSKIGASGGRETGSLGGWMKFPACGTAVGTIRSTTSLGPAGAVAIPSGRVVSALDDWKGPSTCGTVVAETWLARSRAERKLATSGADFIFARWTKKSLGFECKLKPL